MRNDLSNLTLLTVDQGNSSAKVILWKGDRAVAVNRFFSMSIEDIIPILEEENLDGCAYCSTGHTDAKLLETLRRLLDGKLLVVTPSTPVPIEIVYGTRGTLGLDRVAAAAGTAALFRGECSLIADAGTAMTLDLVAKEGSFLGGNITPGMRLRFRSLHEATDRLPLVEPTGEVDRFGHDTATAIRSGVIGGMVSEIADLFRYASDGFGCSRIIITGNDAELLLPHLLERGLPVYKESELVGRGLLEIFRYNIDKNF